jgi:hypothetical protein
MRPGSLDLVAQVLDRQLMDANDVPCGKVDDLELRGGPGGALEVAAVLVGPGASTARLPALLALLARLVLGRRIVRIPWDQIEGIQETVRLKCTAASIGLDESQRWPHKVISVLPRSWKE